MIMMQASPAAVGAVQQYLGEEVCLHGPANAPSSRCKPFSTSRAIFPAFLRAKTSSGSRIAFPSASFPETRSTPHNISNTSSKHRTCSLQRKSPSIQFRHTASQVIRHSKSATCSAYVAKACSTTKAPRKLPPKPSPRKPGAAPSTTPTPSTLAMAKAIDEGSHYYALAYAPTNNKTDGRYRRIEVKLPNNAGYKISYRRGYLRR